MLPSGVALRHVVAAVAAACTGSFLLMDCNPSLYCYDRYLQVTAPSRRERRQDSIASSAPANGAARSSTSRNSNSCARAGGYHNFQDINCVWIVGASSGIGREMAEQLAVAGVQHLVLSSRSAAACNAVEDACRRLNPDCLCTVLAPVNVVDHDSLERAVQAIIDIPGVSWPLDMVVMNAGVGQLLPALETDAATTEHIVRSNALWPMILTPLLFAKTSRATTSSQESSKESPSQKLPHLVITSSIAGKLAVPLSAAYAASKFAIQGYFSSLACERPDLRIDLLCPGPVDTEFHRNNNNDATANKMDEPTAPSKMKMPVDRCVALMLSAMQRNRHQQQQPSQSLLSSLLQPLQFQEAWIALQPSLAALYIQQWFPGLQRRILGIVGPKRVQLWREGYDLYDPASWRRQTKASESNTVNGNNAKAVVGSVNSSKDNSKNE